MSIMLTDLFLCSILAGPCAAPQQPATPLPVPAQAADALAAQPTPLPSLDSLLRDIEDADAGLTTLSAEVSYLKEFTLEGDPQLRVGSLAFKQNAPDLSQPIANRKGSFGVRFRTLDIGDNREEIDQTIVFDGRFLFDKDGVTKQFVTREIVSEMDFAKGDVNPLRLGQGPFPVPLGQRAADIRAHYDPEVVPTAEGLEGFEHAGATPETLAKFVAQAVQLKLTPKQAFAEDEFQEVRLWYVRDGSGVLVPRMVRAKTGESTSLIRLRNAVLNAPPDPLLLAAVPPNVEAGWKVRFVALGDDFPADHK